jgi:hypothetical protein
MRLSAETRATCGVGTTLLSANRSWPGGRGSESVRSRPAPEIVPNRSAATRSSVTTGSPREQFTWIARMAS